MRTISRVLILSVLVGVLPGCTTYNVVTPNPPRSVPVPTYDKKDVPKAQAREKKREKRDMEEVPKCQEPAYWKKERDGYVCVPPPQPPPMVVVPPYGLPGWYGYGWPYRYWW